MKLDFRALEIDDRDLFDKILSGANSNSFSKSFGSYFLWSENHKTKICFDDDILYIKYDKKNLAYEMPKGVNTSEALKKSVNLLLDYHAKTRGDINFKFTRLLKFEAEKLELMFPGKFKIEPERNDFEYIYSVEELSELKGKKYHSKRGHIKKFSKNNLWEYSALNINKKEDYILFFRSWFEERPDANPNEMIAIEKALKYYNELKLYGGMILVEKKIVAGAVGEKIDDETFVVHFEKALSEFSEAYAVINNELCKKIQNEYKFINREEDLGIPGLRKSKLSYHPQFFIEKYSAVEK